MTQQAVELTLMERHVPGKQIQFYLIGPKAPSQVFHNEAGARQWARTHGVTVRKAEGTYNGSKTCSSCEGQINPVHAMLNPDTCESCNRRAHTERVNSRMAQ